VRFLFKSLSQTLCLAVWLMALSSPAAHAEVAPAALRQLATRAAQRDAWPALRAYAQSQKNPEWRGWARFLAGYHENEAADFREAAEDLRQAVESAFSLADYALFYEASALSQAGQQLEAQEALKDFVARFPESRLRWRALELRAGACLEAQRPQDALDALTAEPEVRKRPPLALLLARAYEQSQQMLEAARAYQEVYFAFPMSPQAKAAADSLAAIRPQLGSAYPLPTDEIQTARGQILFKAARYEDARKEFEELLKAQPASPFAPHWQLGRVRCLLHLQRASDAAEALFNHFTTADLEAQRLGLLVLLHAQQSDAAAITQDLAQLETQYAASSAHADALSAAGNFYYRQLNWQEAARAYQRLFELFPLSEHAREGGWRLTWCSYLLHDPKAPEAMRDYLARFPDSARAPAVLYWLGRTKEEQGSPVEARELYALLTKRFVHSYYAHRAAARLATLQPEQGSPQGAGGPLAVSLATLLAPTLSAPANVQGLACLPSAPSDAARPAMILQVLGLDSVAEEYLKMAVTEGTASAELRLLLAQVDAAKKNATGALFDAIKVAPAYAQMDFPKLPEEVWDFLYPQSYWKLIQRQARANHLDPPLVMGLVRQESAFNAGALSIADARGLMQVLPETAAHSRSASRLRSTGQRLYDPAYNVRIGCAYLKTLMKAFDNQPELALAAYHAGDFRVREWMGKTSFQDSAMFLESIPIPATRSYVELVLRDAEIYRQILTGSPRFAVCAQAKTAAPPRAPGSARRPGGTEGKKREPAPRN
jgi:soluble lytic murein transglycosylase